MSPFPVQDSPQRKVERLVWLIFSIGCLVFMLATGLALIRSGMFSDKEIVKLLSDHASGLSIGMNVEFNGFPIGRVQNFMLRDDGNVTVVLAMDADQMRWLNGSTRFELQTPPCSIWRWGQ
ncbi:MAG: MCE family protein [Verrucomicrobia bacterium]|nr:MCE family protein [Verrucomicrobiota bacterium]